MPFYGKFEFSIFLETISPVSFSFILLAHVVNVRRIGRDVVPSVKDNNILGTQKTFPWISKKGTQGNFKISNLAIF